MALLAVVLGICPFLLGLFYTGFTEKEKNNILLHMAAGYVIMFGLFEITALPLISASVSDCAGVFVWRDDTGRFCCFPGAQYQTDTGNPFEHQTGSAEVYNLHLGAVSDHCRTDFYLYPLSVLQFR